jgi:hypothetical protein
MLDFYALAATTPVAVGAAGSNRRVVLRDAAARSAFYDFRAEAIEHFYKHLLIDLELIVAAEVVGHFFPTGVGVGSCCVKGIRGSGKKNVSQFDFAASHGKEAAAFYAAILSGKVAELPEYVQSGSGGNEYRKSYSRALFAQRHSGMSVLRFGTIAFAPEVNWANSYGGEKWLVIANAALDVLRARDLNSRMTAIDYVCCLHHNTNTLFTKCKHHNAQSTAVKALDVKFSALSPFAFAHMTSPKVQAWLETIYSETVAYRQTANAPKLVPLTLNSGTKVHCATGGTVLVKASKPTLNKVISAYLCNSGSGKDYWATSHDVLGNMESITTTEKGKGESVADSSTEQPCNKAFVLYKGMQFRANLAWNNAVIMKNYLSTHTENYTGDTVARFRLVGNNGKVFRVFCFGDSVYYTTNDVTYPDAKEAAEAGATKVNKKFTDNSIEAVLEVLMAEAAKVFP